MATLPPLDVALAVIPSLPRPLLARLVARLIDRLDEIDGDPDLEPDDHDEPDDPDESDGCDEMDCQSTDWAAVARSLHSQPKGSTMSDVRTVFVEGMFAAPGDRCPYLATSINSEAWHAGRSNALPEGFALIRVQNGRGSTIWAEGRDRGALKRMTYRIDWDRPEPGQIGPRVTGELRPIDRLR